MRVTAATAITTPGVTLANIAAAAPSSILAKGPALDVNLR
jgi:hypothetical protein